MWWGAMANLALRRIAALLRRGINPKGPVLAARGELRVLHSEDLSENRSSSLFGQARISKSNHRRLAQKHTRCYIKSCEIT